MSRRFTCRLPVRLTVLAAALVGGVAVGTTYVAPTTAPTSTSSSAPAAREAARAPGRSAIYSHGDDDAALAAAPTGLTSSSRTTGLRPRCARAGTPAFQVLYAYPRSQGSRRASALDTIRRAIRTANGAIHGAALETSRWDVRLRVRCNSDRAIAVGSYALSKAGDDAIGESFDQIVAAGHAAGLRSPLTKYVVFWDSDIPGMCGQGQMHLDSRRSVTNANNSGDVYAVVYGRGCWTGAAVLHEIGHTMGAVENDAPHATGADHCFQGEDIMCYADGGPRGKRTSMVSTCVAIRFDCRHDDYFRAGHVSGYLATHWNLGWVRNRFLSFVIPR